MSLAFVFRLFYRIMYATCSCSLICVKNISDSILIFIDLLDDVFTGYVTCSITIIVRPYFFVNIFFNNYANKTAVIF